jgi:DNA invertase Pin-like site-specific DNA recombinase
MNRNKKVLAYARVSTSHLDQNPEHQLKEIRRYCDARGWEIIEELVDYGISGTTDARPAYKKLKLLVSQRKTEGVVITKLDRLSRSIKDAVLTMNMFQEVENFEFVSIQDNIDLKSSTGRFVAHLLFSVAQLERDMIVSRVKSGLEHARERGVRLGRPPFKNENEIVKLRSEGKTYLQIQNLLGVSASVITRVLRAHANPPAK